MSFEWYGKKVKKQNRKAANKALWKYAEAVLTRANTKVPHDEGTLERSGIVSQAKLPNAQSIFNQAKNGNAPTAKFDFAKGEMRFYISYNTPYAIKLHESSAGEFNFRDKGENKWLEKAAKEMSNKMESFIGTEMKKRL
jgi:hypothetical protein